MTVFVYINTSKQVGDAEHIKVFANVDAAEKWFEENDPEGVAFEYEVLDWRKLQMALMPKLVNLERKSHLHYWPGFVSDLDWHLEPRSVRVVAPDRIPSHIGERAGRWTASTVRSSTPSSSGARSSPSRMSKKYRFITTSNVSKAKSFLTCLGRPNRTHD